MTTADAQPQYETAEYWLKHWADCQSTMRDMAEDVARVCATISASRLQRDTALKERCSCGVLNARAHFCADLDHCWRSGLVLGGGA